MNGYAGKILRVNLTIKKTFIIPTKNYEQWIGGHGIGSAIFWDLVKDKTIDGFNPANVVTIMTSPLCGTLAPAASARTEVQGIGVQSYPVGWFTRSNFGGRFSSMLKYAGWDGIVIEGRADKPVWIDLRNEKVLIKDADHLWGLETWETQKTIWSEVMNGRDSESWRKLGSEDDAARTTQKPAVLTIDPAGENLSQLACLIHDASNAAEMIFGLVYIRILQMTCRLKTAKIPDCPLDFSKYGSKEFIEQFVRMLAYGNDGKGNESQFGRDISGGFIRAAEKWGRRIQDLDSGILAFPYWGIPIHKEPRAQVYWGYDTLLGDRDINEHDFDWIKWEASNAKSSGREPSLTAEEVVKIVTDKMVPFQGDLDMLDFSENNIYSEHMAKLVSWQRYYTRFWKQSMLFCDSRWPDFVNIHRPDKIGSTGIAETKYLKAVTGKDVWRRSGFP